MNAIRLTIIEPRGSISFVGPGHGSKIFAAACSSGPEDLSAMLAAAQPYDAELVAYLLDGLANFDEHNGEGQYGAIHARLAGTPPAQTPPFRVVDEVTRAASLTPVGAGVILYNLPARRIVQIQNTYSEIRRKGRVRVLRNNQPTDRVHRYELPEDWSLVPSRTAP